METGYVYHVIFNDNTNFDGVLEPYPDPTFKKFYSILSEKVVYLRTDSIKVMSCLDEAEMFIDGFEPDDDDGGGDEDPVEPEPSPGPAKAKAKTPPPTP